MLSKNKVRICIIIENAEITTLLARSADAGTKAVYMKCDLLLKVKVMDRYFCMYIICVFEEDKNGRAGEKVMKVVIKDRF